VTLAIDQPICVWADEPANQNVEDPASTSLKDDVLRRWREAKAALRQTEDDVYGLEEKLGVDHPDVDQARSMLDVARNRETAARSEYFSLRGQNDKGQPARDRYSQTLSTVDEQHAKDANTATELARREEEIALRERRLQATMAHLEQLERQRAQERDEPPIEGAVAQIFPLRYAKAAEAAQTLESLFGSQVRVAVDDRSNNLVVSGKEKSLEAVRSLLQGLDEPSIASNDGGPATESPTRTVLLRVFWLADGLPEGEGQEPSQFLPSAAIKAMDRLGLNKPRLVTQTVNSLAVGDQREVEFTTQVPAILLKQPVNLQCSGRMQPIPGDKKALDIQLNVAGQGVICELKGSLGIPLGHYMVLGTANSVIPDQATLAAQAGAFYGGEGGYGRRGYGGFAGEGGFGRGEADPAAAMAAEGAPQAVEPTYQTSRFAFVVQLIEGESYAAEE
jgi:hypothetical protein